MSTLTAVDHDHLARSIELAEFGLGRVHPNPMVGATVLAQGALVGEGWHAEFGDRHAEPIALRDAGEEPRAMGQVVVVRASLRGSLA